MKLAKLIVNIVLFPKSTYKIRKVKKLVSRDIDYEKIDGMFGDSLNNQWDWNDTDNNGKFKSGHNSFKQSFYCKKYSN